MGFYIWSRRLEKKSTNKQTAQLIEDTCSDDISMTDFRRWFTCQPVSLVDYEKYIIKWNNNQFCQIYMYIDIISSIKITKNFY